MARLSDAKVLDLFESACTIVAAHYRIGRAELLEGRGKTPTIARQVAMYLVYIRGVTLTTVAELFGGRTRQTARYAVAKVEDMRDKEGFDAVMDNLEILVIRHRGKSHGSQASNEARVGDCV